MHFLLFSLIFPFLAFGQVKGLDKELEEKFNQTTKELSSPVLEKNFFSDLFNNQTKKVLETYLKENPFSKMEKSGVRNLIESILNNQKIGKVLSSNPKAMDFLVTWLHDDNALPKFISIINKPKGIKIFGYVVLGVFILSFILNLMNSGSGILKRIIFKLFIFIGATSINLIAFVIIFREEISPTIRIFRDSIF